MLKTKWLFAPTFLGMAQESRQVFDFFFRSLAHSLSIRMKIFLIKIFIFDMFCSFLMIGSRTGTDNRDKKTKTQTQHE